MKTVPTGLFTVPPVGPDIPVHEIPISVLNIFLTLKPFLQRPLLKQHHNHQSIWS